MHSRADSSRSSHSLRPPSRSKERALGGLLLCFLAVYACGKETTGLDNTPMLTAVVVTPSSGTLFTAGETLQLQASARDQNGNPIAGKVFSWTSDDVDVATVDSNGLVTAAGANGSVTVTATSEGKTGSATVELVTGPQGGTVSEAGGQVTLEVPAGAVAQPITIVVTPVSVPPTAETLVAGTAFEFGPDGTQFDEPVQLTIEYDAADLPADVPEDELRLHKLVNGVWEEVQGGTVDVATSTVTGAIDSFSMYACLGLQVSTVEVTPPEATIVVGETVQLTATVADVFGNTLFGRPVTWESEDDAIATIDDAGLVTAVAEGLVSITATSQGGRSGSAAITVTGRVGSVTVLPSETVVLVGAAVDLVAEVRDGDGDLLEGFEVVWTSDDEAVCTVDADGHAVGVAAGECTVTATSQGISGAGAITVVESVAVTFARTESGYAWDTLDFDAVCQEAFGPEYRLADWQDVLLFVEAQGLEAFYQQSRMLSYRANGWVTRSGSHLAGPSRHYFIERHDGLVPSGWLVHEAIGANEIDLGSWYNSRPALCFTPVGR